MFWSQKLQILSRLPLCMTSRNFFLHSHNLVSLLTPSEMDKRNLQQNNGLTAKCCFNSGIPQIFNLLCRTHNSLLWLRWMMTRRDTSYFQWHCPYSRCTHMCSKSLLLHTLQRISNNYVYFKTREILKLKTTLFHQKSS